MKRSVSPPRPQETATSVRSAGSEIPARPRHRDEPRPLQRVADTFEVSRSADQRGQRHRLRGAPVEAALEAQKMYWEEVLSNQQVNTPDPAFNTMLNVHNPHQCYITKNWSRYLSLYQLGYGARGIGFRDSSQDVLIKGCFFSVGDDCIALKGSKGPFAMQDVDSPPVERVRI